MKRKPMTRRASKKSFSKGTRIHPRNAPPSTLGSRGGIRL